MSDEEESFDDSSFTGLEWEEAPDTVEDCYYGEDDEGYWLSEDHLKELREANTTDKIPPRKSWQK